MLRSHLGLHRPRPDALASIIYLSRQDPKGREGSRYSYGVRVKLLPNPTKFFPSLLFNDKAVDGWTTTPRRSPSYLAPQQQATGSQRIMNK